ncbi:MAG: PAS domain S-box protein, partial [Deltaproteobacteria bacterium]|nr:PAS domain S-box protein [Deltaproteobacteria bacterium]
MKLKYKINLVPLSILIAVACAIAAAGVAAINDVTYDLNRKLMSKEVDNLVANVQAAHQVLKNSGVAGVDSYVRKTQDDLLLEFRQYRFETTGRLMVARKLDAELLYDPFPWGQSIRPENLAEMIRSGKGTATYVCGGKARFFCFDTYPEWQCLIILSVTTEEMLEGRTGFLANVMAIMLVSLVLGSALFLFFTSRLVRPILQLAAAATRVSRGEWEVELPVSEEKDEVAQLTRSFRDMSVKLAATYRNLQENLETVERSQEALAAEKERLAVTLSSIGDGVITTDVEGRIVLINKVAETLTGWNREEAIGRPLEEIFHIINEKTGIRCANPVEQVIKSHGVVGLTDDQTILLGRDGVERAIADSGAPIFDRESKIIGAVLVFRNITEKRKMQEELLRAQKLESVGILAGGLAHDFNNILTVILGNASLIKLYMKPTGQALKKLTEIETASLKAKGLTQQLLTFSKGGAPVKKTMVISQLLKGYASFALTGAKTRCEFDIPDDLWLSEVDEGQISQVIHNLISNADQAMPEGGIIGVHAENLIVDKMQAWPLEPGKYIKISIHDQGVGIPEESISKVFDPYFTTKSTGSGLGLTTAYAIITKHKGLLTVESKPGSGTTFHLFLPASDKEKAEEADLKEIPVAGKGKILVMDDDESVRELVGDILHHLGYEAAFA